MIVQISGCKAICWLDLYEFDRGLVCALEKSDFLEKLLILLLASNIRGLAGYPNKDDSAILETRFYHNEIKY